MFANALSIANQKRYAQILTSQSSFLKERVSNLLKSVAHVCTVAHRFDYLEARFYWERGRPRPQ